MSATIDSLRTAIVRACYILSRSFGKTRIIQARAAGDARKVLQAALAGEVLPETPTETWAAAGGSVPPEDVS